MTPVHFTISETLALQPPANPTHKNTGLSVKRQDSTQSIYFQILRLNVDASWQDSHNHTSFEVSNPGTGILSISMGGSNLVDDVRPV